jgi:oxygen-independent coproporphyrinogen-3 oxidase
LPRRRAPAALHAGADPGDHGQRERIGEALFSGLRRSQGIDLARFADFYGVDPLARFGAKLTDAFAAGLLEVTQGRLRLSERGVLLSNEVFQSFV